MSPSDKVEELLSGLKLDQMTSEAQDDYEDECMPFHPVPAEHAKLFEKCREAAIRHREVYPPSDDTMLMIEHVGDAVSGLLTKDQTNVGLLEIGCGSGMIMAAQLSLILKAYAAGYCQDLRDVNIVCTDKNPDAVRCAFEMLTSVCNEPAYALRKLSPEIVENSGTRLACSVAYESKIGGEVLLRLACYQDSEFAQRAVAGAAKRPFDVVFFNPPYVVGETEEERDEMKGQGISISWAGGVKGREVIDRFLFGKEHKGQLGKLLNPTRGSFIMCGLVENEPEEILNKMQKTECNTSWKFDGKILEIKECGIEKLFCLSVAVKKM